MFALKDWRFTYMLERRAKNNFNIRWDSIYVQLSYKDPFMIYKVDTLVALLDENILSENQNFYISHKKNLNVNSENV